MNARLRSIGYLAATAVAIHGLLLAGWGCGRQKSSGSGLGSDAASEDGRGRSGGGGGSGNGLVGSGGGGGNLIGTGGTGGGAPGGAGGSLGGAGLPGTEGRSIACPVSAPTGSCDVEGQSCVYATETCSCVGGTWSCGSCPQAQPSTGTSCGSGGNENDGFGGGNPPFNCAYGAVACYCPGGGAEATWACGVCPASPPASTSACGNSSFGCLYASTSCICSPVGWECGSRTCPPPVTGPFVCAGVAPLICDYPIEGQICRCRPYWACTCPRAVPREGSLCVGNPRPCEFGETSCVCSSRAWHCTFVCPTNQPTAGSSCSSMLSCSYDAGLCYCDGSRWICS